MASMRSVQPSSRAQAMNGLASLAVEIGQREPADAALGGGADLRQRHQALPEALAVDVRRIVAAGGGRGWGWWSRSMAVTS